MVYFFWPVFSWICKSLSQTDPGIQHERFNTTYHWAHWPKAEADNFEAGWISEEPRGQGWLPVTRQGRFFVQKNSHFHIGWLQDSESVVQQFSRVFCLSPLAFHLHLQAPWVDLNGLPWVIYTWMPGVSSSLDCRANRCFSTNSLLGLRKWLAGRLFQWCRV